MIRPLLTLLCCIPLCALRAESPSDHAWAGRWIGPAADTSVLAALDLSGAQWIWHEETGVDPVRNAPGGTRFFRASLDLPAGAKVLAAGAIAAADNSFRLVINGKPAGSGANWAAPTTMDVASLLVPGKNDILVEAGNDQPTGPINAAGWIGKIRVVLEGGEPMELVSGADWQSSMDGQPASAWTAARAIGGLGAGPWQGVQVASTGAVKNLWTIYRKAFELKDVPAAAPARIAVDSKYWLWINGKPVVREGGVKRGPTPSDTYFDVVDLAPHLSKGKNQIAVLAWYFGKDGFSHKNSGKAGLLFEMDAGGTKVVSDGSWKTTRHPAFGEAGNTPNFRLSESSVHFDARQDIPGWESPGFDDSGFAAAADLGAPPCAPWNRLWERSIPQWKDFGLRDYENAGSHPRVSNGEPIKAQLPYNAQITPWLKIKAPAGLMLKMTTDNPLNEIHAEYVTREGVQEFETPAWMSGHHVIYHLPQGVEILGLKFRESGFDTTFTGYFRCDDPFLEKLWTMAERTLYVNMRDTFFDCPDRERAAWWGDIVIQLGEVFYSLCPRSHSLIRKCMYNLANWQRPSKTLFSPIPAGNWDKELPQQMLASVGQFGFWTYYLNTGDAGAIIDLYPHVKDYLSIWEKDSDGLIIHRAGENGWDWADWGNNVDLRVLDNAWYCLALEGAARMAEVAGKPEDAAAFLKEREGIVAAVNRKFWTGKAYRDPGYQGATDDRANGLAVIARIAGPDKFPAIKEVLATEFHASPYMEKYILESLFWMDDPAAALTRMKKRYKEMVESETSTLWELFNRDGTLNHAWTGGPLTLMCQYVAGAAPTSPAWKTYQVKPRMGPLKKAATGFDTVSGRVELAIRRGDANFHLTLDSPAGTEATVCLPLDVHGLRAVQVKGKTVWLNGKANGQVDGLRPGPAMPGHACFIVAPGKWEFEAR